MDHQLHISLEMKTTEQVKEAKLLGVTNEQRLSWSIHIDYIVAKMIEAFQSLGSVHHSFQRQQLNKFCSLCSNHTAVTGQLFSLCSASKQEPDCSALFIGRQRGWNRCQTVVDEGGRQAGM